MTAHTMQGLHSMNTLSLWIPDNSAIQAFRENPEMFRLRYRLHLQPARPDDKKLAGSAIHAGLNARNLGWPLEECVRIARELRGDAPGFRTAAHVERVLRGYETRYPRDAEPFTVTLTEEYTEAYLGCTCGSGATAPEHTASCRGFWFCGILDGAVRFPDSSEYVKDVKSTGAYLNEQWQATMQLADQFVGYTALRRALGHRCDGFYVDGIRMNDYIKKGATVPEVSLEKDFCRAGPFRITDWQIERWIRNVRWTLDDIARCEATYGLDKPWPFYQNFAYGKPDAYAEFYASAPELHDSIARTFEVRPWNPKEEAAKRAVAPAAQPLQGASA
jgi:hypothetical protein